MYGLKKIGKVLTSKSVGTEPSSYEKRIYQAAVSQRLRNTALYITLSFLDATVKVTLFRCLAFDSPCRSMSEHR